MTDTSDDLSFDPDGDGRTLEDLLPDLRHVRLYMIRMEFTEPVASPIDHLRPHLRDHALWLRHQERTGALFMSGPNRCAEEWDGSGTLMDGFSCVAAAAGNRCGAKSDFADL